MKDRFGRRTDLRMDEAPSRWRVAAFAGAALLFFALAFGFLAVRDSIRASAVVEALDDRAASIRQEIADAREVSLRQDEVLSEIAALEAELDALHRAVPCDLGLPALLPDIRARLEPLGVQVRTDLGFKQRQELLELARVPIVLPPRDGAEAEVRSALSGTGRLLRIEPYGTAPDTRVIVAHAVASCDAEPAEPPGHREVIAWRSGLRWPFDRTIVQREKEIEALRTERDATPGLAELLRRDHLRWEIRTLTQMIAQLRSAPGVIATD